MTGTSPGYRALAVASVVVLFVAVVAGIFQSFRTRGGPPSLSIAPGQLALGLLDAGDYEAAAREYANALRLGPERADRGTLLALYAQSLEGLGRSEEALAKYRESLAAGFDAPEVRLRIATSLTELRRFDEAVGEFRVALAGADDARGRNNLGYALERLGDRSAAIEEFRRATLLAPDLANAHRNLGRSLLLAGHLSEAVDALVVAVRLEPESALAHARLGDAHWRLGHYDEAADAYLTAARLAPDDPGVRDGAIKSLLAAGRERDAIAQLKRAVSAGDRDAALMNELAWRLATSPDPALRDPAEALRIAEGAVEISANPHALDTLAAAYAAAGRFEDAVATAERAIREAERRDRSALADEIRTRLSLFAAGRAYVDDGTPFTPESAESAESAEK